MRTNLTEIFMCVIIILAVWHILYTHKGDE